MIDLKAASNCCEEASHLSREFYIPCDKPAVRLINNGDHTYPYRMCEACAQHNVRSRGAEDIGPYIWEPGPHAGNGESS